MTESGTVPSADSERQATNFEVRQALSQLQDVVEVEQVGRGTCPGVEADRPGVFAFVHVAQQRQDRRHPGAATDADHRQYVAFLERERPVGSGERELAAGS